MTRIVIPEGLTVMDEPQPAERQRFYWLREALREPGDPEAARPAVVLVEPTARYNEIIVGLRSSTEENGARHSEQPPHLKKVGWFSRGRSINPVLWTPNNAERTELLLDEETFAYVWNDLVPEHLR